MIEANPDGWCPYDRRLCPIWKVFIGLAVSPPASGPPVDFKTAHPEAVLVTALLDTGCSHTFAEPALLQRLGAKPTGERISVHGADPLGNWENYHLDLALPFTDGAAGLLGLGNFPVSSGTLSWGGDVPRYHVVIGCDVLHRCRFTLEGERFRLTPRDASGRPQHRARIFVIGANARVLAAVPAGSTTVPLDSTAIFSAAGGSVVTPSGSVLTYTGKSAVDGHASTVGNLLGFTININSAGILGAGNVDNGGHVWAQTIVTLAGETLIGGTGSATCVGGRQAQIGLDGTSDPSAIARRLYRSKAGTSSPLYLVTTIPDSSATLTFIDNVADANLGALAPTVNTAATVNLVAAGSASLPVGSASGLASAGWVLVSGQYVSYTGVSSNTLTGIPASGVGSIASNLPANAPVVMVPFLSGVGSLSTALAAGDNLSIWVRRDDAAAQAALAALEGGDGIHEFMIRDAGLTSIAACNAAGDAELALGKNAIETAELVSEDPAMVPGASVVINVSGISTTLPIAHVTISWKVGRKNPQRAVTATSQDKTFSQYLADIQAKSA